MDPVGIGGSLGFFLYGLYVVLSAKRSSR